MQVIKRYFSEDKFKTVKSDIQFLVEKVIQSGFEYDLQIRDNYFNLYYKGNSVGKISLAKRTGLYNVSIHSKFISEKIKIRFSPKSSGSYLEFNISPKQLHPLFSSSNLKSMGQRVKEVFYQEEVTFEQMLMTDNVGRDDFIIIDRQVVDKTAKTQMDLLALSKTIKNDYQFCILEVKLGNNPELQGDVIDQLHGYIKRISSNFSDYKICYERNLKQKQVLGLLSSKLNVNIIPDVTGLVVVLGYSGVAKSSIQSLKSKDPSIKVLHLRNHIDPRKAL